MSYESIKPPTAFDNSVASALNYIGNKTRVNFDGGSLKQDKITFSHGKIINIYIVYEVNLWNYVYSFNLTLGNSLLGVVKLIKNADIDKYSYSGYSIGFDMKGTFRFPTIGFGRNAIIFGADMDSSIHSSNKKKYILIIGKSPTQKCILLILQNMVNFFV